MEPPLTFQQIQPIGHTNVNGFLLPSVNAFLSNQLKLCGMIREGLNLFLGSQPLLSEGILAPLQSQCIVP